MTITLQVTVLGKYISGAFHVAVIQSSTVNTSHARGTFPKLRLN